MDYDEHVVAVNKYFEIVDIDEDEIENVLNLTDLNEALYAMDELGLWYDDVEVSAKQAYVCWKIINKIKKDGFPEELGM